MFIRIITLAILLSTPALAQTNWRTDLVRGLCQPTGCDEFAILGVERIATTEDGSLFRTRLKTFQASQSGRRDLGEESGYVYCSPTKPAIMADQDGRTMAFFLAPFATAESRESVRRNANYHAVYFAICHGPDAGRAAVRDLPGVAQSLGYHVSLAQSKVVALNRAEDILAPAERPPVATMREERLLPPAEVPIDRAPLRQPPVVAAEPREGLLGAPRRFTNRAFGALNEVGNWVLGW